MAETQAVVDALNATLKTDFSLVTFDALSPSGLRGIVADILKEVDSVHAENAGETPETTAARWVAFLQVLKCPMPQDTSGFGSALVAGDKDAAYSVLSYLLSRLPALKKRAYVARYLMPVELPPELQHHEGVMEALAQYTALQSEFKEAHMAFERAAALGSQKQRPSELRRDIAQLSDERSQLVEKLSALRKRTADMPGFKALLDATSSLRKEQEEEGRLAERVNEQNAALSATERRYGEVNRRLAETRAATQEGLSAEAVLENARREALEGKQLLHSVLPVTLSARQDTLQKLHTILSAPRYNEDDLFRLRGEVQAAEEEVARVGQAVTAVQRGAGEDKLAMFRQQAALVSKKLSQREESLEAAQRELEQAVRELESTESKLSELSGPKYMKREEFKLYAAALRAKTATFKELKSEHGALHDVTSSLLQAESALQPRAGEFAERSMGGEGEQRAVAAARSDIRIENAAEELGAGPLTDLAKVVVKILAAIKQQKAKLAPSVTQLRSVRSDVAQLEGRHTRERASYEAVSAGYETTTLALEKEADAVQEQAVSLENKLGVLRVEVEVAGAQLDRAAEEATYERGEGRLTREHRTHKELLSQKLGQLDALGKELRKTQGALRDTSESGAQQKKMFVKLVTLLEAKAGSVREGVLRAADASASAQGDVFADTNVMTLMS